MEKVNNTAANVSQLQHVNKNNDLPTNYTGILYIDWKSHFLWFLSVACFICSKLWWLVPLPGDAYLPPYRTYPAAFFNNIFITLAVGLASRSLPVGLINIPFTEGIHVDSVINYKSTGGYAAMWSGIRFRSGIRYFLLASLVTIAILLGNALEGEFQSSVSIFYKSSHTLSNMKAIECQHSSSNDYQAASDAYASNLITHTLSDIPSRLLDKTSLITMSYYSIALYKTSLTPVSNISLATEMTKTLKRRHHQNTSTCRGKYKNSASSDATTSATTSATTLATTSAAISTATPVITTSSPEINTNASNNVYQTEPYAALTLDGHQYTVNLTDFNNVTQLTVLKNTYDGLYYPITSKNTTTGVTKTVQLNVMRYRASDNQVVVVVYSSPSDNIVAGAYISCLVQNYTCRSSFCFPPTDNAEIILSNNEAIADELVKSIQSNIGYYGTSLLDGLVLNLLNGRNERLKDQSKLADALFMNSNCPSIVTSPTQGYLFMPYSSAHWTILSILWISLFVVVYLIGAYLIGCTEKSWAKLARTGHMIPQILHNSSNLFVDSDGGKIVDKTTYLDKQTAKLSFVKEYHVGYTVTSEVVDSS